MSRRGFVLAVRLLGLGWYVALSIILGAFGGHWLDGRLGTDGVFILVGVSLGTIVALYGVYRLVEPLMGGDNGANNQ